MFSSFCLHVVQHVFLGPHAPFVCPRVTPSILVVLFHLSISRCTPSVLLVTTCASRMGFNFGGCPGQVEQVIFPNALTQCTLYRCQGTLGGCCRMPRRGNFRRRSSLVLACVPLHIGNWQDSSCKLVKFVELVSPKE